MSEIIKQIEIIIISLWIFTVGYGLPKRAPLFSAFFTYVVGSSK